MKVLLINGSPHKNGCTFTALSEIAKTLQECGVDSEIFHIGAAPIRGCMGCGGCAGKGKCIYEDTVNTAIEKAAEADGFIFGSPVHYASAGGGITSFLDRMFYAGKSFPPNLHAIISVQILSFPCFPILHNASYYIREKRKLLSNCCLRRKFVVSFSR